MRLDLSFDVGGQRPVVSAKRRHLAVDTFLTESAVVPLPAGDKCIIVVTTGEAVSARLLIPLLTEDGLPILTESGEPLLVEETGSAISFEPGGSIVFPGRSQHGALNVDITGEGTARVTVIQ